MRLEIERRFSENPDLAFVECWYWVRKLQARFFAGDYASAMVASSRAQRVMWICVSQFETPEYLFYGALSQAACCHSAASGERQQHLRRYRSASQATPALGGELPGEFRESRRTGRGGDCPLRGPRARCRAPIRTGHPLGARKRLCPQ